MRAKCDTYPDNMVAIFHIGTACDTDGNLSIKTSESVTIVNECIRAGIAENSYKLTVEGENVLGLEFFSE